MQLALTHTSLAAQPVQKIRKTKFMYFLGVACLFFFFNSFLLPDGLLYTILLTPVFMLWMLTQKAPLLRYCSVFVLCWAPIAIIHYALGVSMADYLKSSALYFTVFLFACTVYTYFKNYAFTYQPIMERILKLNFVFVLMAIAWMAAGETQPLWNVADISEGVSQFPRLKMFTYEPSYYSLLLVPSLFFYLQFIFYRNMPLKKWPLFLTILLALVLSLSYGAIFISLLTFGLFVLYNAFSGLRRRQNKRFMFILSTAIVIGVVLVLTLFADSGFVLRVLNIIDGNDSSVSNRSSQAYFLAVSIADLKSQLFGVGPGQLKILGQDMISTMYSYAADETTGEMAAARIPSSMAETLAVFGWLGFFAKLFAEMILYRKTKVKRSSFRLCLFIFMFIYQFVGSFSTNILEIFYWVLAFSNVFPDTYFKKPDPQPQATADPA